MPSYEASVVTKASAEAAWTAWIDVESWSAYDHIESARIDGALWTRRRYHHQSQGLPRQQLDRHPH
jgi:hypothetical protein